MVIFAKMYWTENEIQIDFGASIIHEKGKEQYLITSIDRYSKYPTAEILNNASRTNVIKFLNNYIYIITEYPELLDWTKLDALSVKGLKKNSIQKIILHLYMHLQMTIEL